MTVRAEAPWAKLPLALVEHEDATLAALRVFAYVDHRCGKRGWWYGAQHEIAADLGLGERSVRRAVAWLRAEGFIDTSRLGADDATVLLYTVVPITAEPPPAARARGARPQPPPRPASAQHRPATDGRSVAERPATDGRSHRPRMAAPTISGPSTHPSEGERETARGQHLPAALELVRTAPPGLEGIPPDELLAWAQRVLSEGVADRDAREAMRAGAEYGALSTRYLEECLARGVAPRRREPSRPPGGGGRRRRGPRPLLESYESANGADAAAALDRAVRRSWP